MQLCLGNYIEHSIETRQLLIELLIYKPIYNANSLVGSSCVGKLYTERAIETCRSRLEKTARDFTSRESEALDALSDLAKAEAPGALSASAAHSQPGGRARQAEKL